MHHEVDPLSLVCMVKQISHTQATDTQRITPHHNPPPPPNMHSTALSPPHPTLSSKLNKGDTPSPAEAARLSPACTMKNASTAGCRISTAWWSGVRASSFRQSPSVVHSSSRLSCSLSRGSWGPGSASSSFFSAPAPLLVLGPAAENRQCHADTWSSAFTFS